MVARVLRASTPNAAAARLRPLRARRAHRDCCAAAIGEAPRNMLLTDLPAELLILILVQLNCAADFARAAKSCSMCNSAMEVAVRLCAQKRGLRVAGPRPWMHITPFLRAPVGWPFLLRAAEVRKAIFPIGVKRDRAWLAALHNAERNGDAPTKWCIEKEQRAQQRMRMAQRMKAQRLAAHYLQQAQRLLL